MFTLDQVVPWGRSFDEYRSMFALSDEDLTLKIVGCGDGPASFNAVATRHGARVISCDPIYRYGVGQLRQRIAATYDEILKQTRQNANEFVWTTIRSPDELGQTRMVAMNAFLDDYEAGKLEGRYIAAELPNLPFGHETFDLALSSHLLFLYTAQLGEVFHRTGIREMCRVAKEVRIFPLLALGGDPSFLVEPLALELREQGASVSIENVPYEFQRGGDKMMRIRQAPANSQPGPHLALRSLGTERNRC
jgi:hypothetical protein